MVKFETAEDRENERVALDKLAERWKCDIWQMPEYSVFDGIAVMNGECKAMVEYRKYSKNYGHILFNKSKRDGINQIAELTKMVGLFVAEIDGDLYLLKTEEEPDKIGMFERKNPVEGQFPEEVVYYDLGRLKKIIF